MIQNERSTGMKNEKVKLSKNRQKCINVITLLFLFSVLPTQFPHEKPSVRITPGGSHPWLDERVSQISQC